MALRKFADSEGHSAKTSDTTADTESADTGEDGDAIFHELRPEEKEKLEQQKQDFRRQLNRQARELVKGSAHEKVSLIVHRPEATLAHHREYHRIAAALADMRAVIHEFSRKGVLFLAAAIGQDKESICDIYGQERFMDITDLRRLPARLVQIIAKYL